MTMKRLTLAAVVAVACGAGFVAGQVSAQEGGGGFQLPEWTQMSEEHEELAKSVGSWDIEQKMWMAPGQPPMESKASATGALFYEGRFLEMDYKGDMMGTPFTGRLLMGYDRVDKEYVAVWMDSMSAYMSVSRGKYADGATTFKTNDPDFMTGKKKPVDMVMKWLDADTYTLTFIEPAEGGEPKTTMEMKYIRKKE